MRGEDLVMLRDSGGATFVQVEDQRTTGFSINGNSIDITSKDSSGWRELADPGGIRSCSISVEGVWTGSTHQQAMRAISMTGALNDYQVDDGAEVLEGAFQVTSFEIDGDHDGPQTYSATLESVDVPTVT